MHPFCVVTIPRVMLMVVRTENPMSTILGDDLIHGFAHQEQFPFLSALPGDCYRLYRWTDKKGAQRRQSAMKENGQIFCGWNLHSHISFEMQAKASLLVSMCTLDGCH